jgi:hypothetical protein
MKFNMDKLQSQMAYNADTLQSSYLTFIAKRYYGDQIQFVVTFCQDTRQYVVGSFKILHAIIFC